MKKIFWIFLFVAGCAVHSIEPTAGGFEMDMDLTSTKMRHGWAYFGKPKSTEVTKFDEDSVERGKQLFLQHCQKCHGPEAKGGGPLSEALNLGAANLAHLPQDTSKAYILVQIKEGKGSMPKWKDFLTRQQAVDLTNYIKFISKKNTNKKTKKKAS